MSKTFKQTSQSDSIRFYGAGVVDQCELVPDILEVVRGLLLWLSWVGASPFCV